MTTSVVIFQHGGQRKQFTQRASSTQRPRLDVSLTWNNIYCNEAQGDEIERGIVVLEHDFLPTR